MKYAIYLAVLISFFIFIIVSCTPSATITKIYLQKVEVYGPISQTPVHITDSTQTGITIFPRISFNTKKLLVYNI
jgi:hypothetical protein